MKHLDEPLAELLVFECHPSTAHSVVDVVDPPLLEGPSRSRPFPPQRFKQIGSSVPGTFQGPTETVGWNNCCANFGSKLEYETSLGLGGAAVARSTCAAGTPYFAIVGNEMGTGTQIEINGEDLDIAEWP